MIPDMLRGMKRHAGRWVAALPAASPILALLLALSLSVADVSADSLSVAQRLKTDISLTFKNLDCSEAFKILHEQTGINIAISAGVKGTVTLYLTSVEAGDALDLIAAMTGNAYVIDGDMIRVMTGDDYVRKTGRPFQSRHIMKSYPLTHIAANEIISSITQLGLLTAGGKISPDLRSNRIIIWDTPEAHDRVARALNLLDQPTVVERIPLENRSVEDALASLQALAGNQARVDPDLEANALIVSGSPEAVEEIKRHLMVKDVPSILETDIIPLQHAWSDSLLETLRAYMTEGAGQALLIKGGNELSLTDVPGSMPFLRELVDKLDVLPQQVLIEVKILQVSFGTTESIGINWDVVEDELDLISQGRFAVLPGDDGGVTSGVIASVGDLSDEGYNVLVEALSTYGETEIISLPRLRVTTGHEAHIHVGSTEPYVSVETSVTQAGIVQSYERVTSIDVGVKLRVLPIVHPNGQITLEIEPEVSSVSRFLETPGGSSIPVVDQSTLFTEVTVQSGEHVILGGLMETEKRKTERGIPILRSIPLLKYIFGSTEITEGKSELVIVIRPRIVGEGVSEAETDDVEW